jgi:hypothetical protein
VPVTYTISRDERRVTAFAKGIIRATDLHELVKALLADPNLESGMRALYDSRFGEPDITVMQLAEIAGEVRKLFDRGLGRMALVAGSQNTYRVEKTFSVLARALGIEVDVFKDIAAAEVWLGDTGEYSTRHGKGAHP